jgi:hypothetical protein
LVAAAQPAPAPWQWSNDERIAARHRHALQHLPPRTDAHLQVNGTGATPGFTIDGATHAELFLPSELMRRLLRGVSSDPLFRPAFRSQLSDAIREAGFDETTFWATLDRIGAHHADAARRSADVQRALDQSSPLDRRALQPRADALSAEVCSERVQALQDARSEFGRERFDRFLYEGVAPTFSLTFAAPDDDAHVRFLEGGCR